jgi:mRNA interferase MazF
MADLEPIVGHEQGGPPRPVVIISVDPLNHSPAELTMTLPVTSAERGLPSHVALEPPQGGLRQRSFAMCDQLRTISHKRLRRRLGVVDDEALASIEKVLKRLLGFRN